MTKIIKKVNSKLYTIENKRYIRLARNQLQILDALMEDGGNEKKYYDKHKNIRFSEHFGLLDFNHNGLEKIIVSANTDRIDLEDKDILLPDSNISDILDYEYMFHTHPPTPKPGSRISDGILYEFPSIDDIYHFIEHYNKGKTQGSIVIAPEGLYLIHCKGNYNKIKMNYTNIKYNKLKKEFFKIQDNAIDKYDNDFNLNMFYSTIIDDLTYIKQFNKLIKNNINNKITISYKAREYDSLTKKWFLPSIYIPVSVIEPI